MNRQERREWLKAIIRDAGPDADDGMRLAWAVMAVIADDHDRLTQDDVVAGMDNPEVMRQAQALLAKVVRR